MSSYTMPLYALLRRDSKWNWSTTGEPVGVITSLSIPASMMHVFFYLGLWYKRLQSLLVSSNYIQLFVLLSHSQTQILSDGMRLLRKKFCFSNWPLTLLPFQSDYIHSSMWSTITLGIPSISILLWDLVSIVGWIYGNADCCPVFLVKQLRSFMRLRMWTTVKLVYGNYR